MDVSYRNTLANCILYKRQVHNSGILTEGFACQRATFRVSRSSEEMEDDAFNDHAPVEILAKEIDLAGEGGADY